MPEPETVGEFNRLTRLTIGLTQLEFAARLRVGQREVLVWELGRKRSSHNELRQIEAISNEQRSRTIEDIRLLRHPK